MLRTTDGVEQVSSEALGDGLCGFQIRTRKDQDLREAISQRIAKNGWTIRRLDLKRRTLEDRFMEVTQQRDPLSARPSGGSLTEAIQSAAS